MDSIIVGIIVITAIGFSVRSFIQTYKGEGSCSCGEGCTACTSKGACKPDFPIVNKK